MNRIKTLLIAILLIVFVFLGILIIIPEVIPSLEFVQQIIILVLYVANIVFVYVLVVRFRGFIIRKVDKALTVVLTTFFAVFMVGGLAMCFIITSLGIGQGFMGGTLAKELNYPTQKVTIYLYDDSFLDPLTTIKIKNKTFPVMHNLGYIENCQPAGLTIWRHDDTVSFSYDRIELKIDLITRKSFKTYYEDNFIENNDNLQENSLDSVIVQ